MKEGLMFTGNELASMIADVFRLHQEFPKSPQKAFRKFDGKTSYGVHPVLLAMLVLHEDKMLEVDRLRRAKALLGHDLTEQTTTSLPAWCEEPAVLNLINGLTFSEGQDPMIEMWHRGDDVIITKLYDSTGNSMNLGALRPERVILRRENLRLHVAYVEGLYPELEIIKIAKSFLA